MNTSRLFRNFVFLFSMVGLGSLSAVEYKTLMSTSSTPSETITLQDGDVAEILNLFVHVKDRTSNSSYAAINGYLQVDRNGTVLQIPKSFYQFGTYGGGIINMPMTIEGLTITGPATLQCKGHNCLASIKITTSTELAGASQSVAKYATVIPENAKTNVSVILEQSTDLVNWTAANPGDFTPSSSKRFFRVRTANVPVAITGASNAAPIVITSAAHGLNTGDAISVSGVAGNTAANGVFTITKVDDNSFSLNGATGNAAYTSGGTWLPSP
jgi:hypothetical protein